MSDAIQQETRTAYHYSWNRMTWEQRYKFLLSDGPPRGSTPAARLQWVRIETCFYWYLAQASKIRKQSIS